MTTVCCTTFISYNIYLILSSLNFPHFHFQSGHFQASDAACISSPASHQPILNTHTNIPPRFRERPASRRDAATLTDALGNGKRAETWEPGYRGRRRWQLYRPKELYSSEEEQITDEEEELDFRRRRKKHMHTPVYKEERRIREHRPNRCRCFVCFS